VLSSALFNDLNDFRTVLTTELGLDPEAIRDIASLPSDRTRRLNHTEAARLLEVPGPTPYKAQFVKYTNSEQSATLVEVLLSDGPAGKEGLEVLKAIRAVAQRPRFSDAGSSFVVFTDVDDILDMIEQVNVEAPPLLVGNTSVVTFIIAGLAFRSVLVPLRLLLTVVVTIIFVVGLSVWVYGTLIPVGGLYWIVPLSCGCLMIGLSLDYDVFLISEIYELRRAGYSTEAAILRAMGTESATITTAGLIMTVAFSSMLLSVTTVLKPVGPHARRHLPDRHLSSALGARTQPHVLVRRAQLVAWPNANSDTSQPYGAASCGCRLCAQLRLEQSLTCIKGEGCLGRLKLRLRLELLIPLRRSADSHSRV
jgi:hypothetical protein